MNKKMLALTAAAALLPTMANAAGLLGTTVDVQYLYVSSTTTLDTVDSVLVGAGTELTCDGTGTADICRALTAATQTLDLRDTSIRYDYSGSGAGFDNVTVNGFDFQSLFDSGTVITGVTIDTNIANLAAQFDDRLSFSAHSVQLRMGALSLADGAYFELSLQTTPVPEPASAALLLGGLALLAARRRR